MCTPNTKTTCQDTETYKKRKGLDSYWQVEDMKLKGIPVGGSECGKLFPLCVQGETLSFVQEWVT